MASQDGDSSSMFIQKTERRVTVAKPGDPADGDQPEGPTETITVKDFFDFMKTAYQVYEHLEGDEVEGTKIDWDELTKLTVINHVIDQNERDLLLETAHVEPKATSSKSESSLCIAKSVDRPGDKRLVEKRSSCNDIDGKRATMPDGVKMLGVWTEANLNCKLNDVVNEGILDSILPYLVGYKKPTKTTSVYQPIIKKGSTESNDVKKLASFGGFVNERESRDRLGRRKSSVIMALEQRQNSKHDGEVEIHVCDEVKGLKKDFRCPQKLLVSKMGYFADVTAGQKLEDMDISVHCDIQIFDWLMRWVKRDSILVADWPLLEPGNVVPILVSASFLQMEPLLHDCLIYCHAHMNEIVKTSTNLACLSDALLTRLAAMYTNAELEGVRDRRDKVQSRLYCKMILSLAEPVPETLRGHYATLATLFKCSKCNKLLGRHIAEQVPCQPASMKIDRRGNMVAMHTKDTLWSLNEYISWLYGELRSWRRVYWRLWADCHLLRCQLCESYFPAYQMEWCSHHEQGAHMFALEGRPPLPAGRFPCCGERAYRFETITRNTGCQFREHAPDERLPSDAAVMDIYSRFREIIAMRPPQLVFPERLTRLITREPGEEAHGRLQCKEVFWWEGLQLAPPRQPLGLLGKLYTSNNRFNPQARPGSAAAARASEQSLNAPPPPGVRDPSPERPLKPALPKDADSVKPTNPTTILVPVMRLAKQGGARALPAGGGGGDSGSEQSDSSDSDSESSASGSGSARSEEEAPPRRPGRRLPPKPAPVGKKRARVAGRQWISSLSARSNQDGQRRFEERAVRQMRQALARRAALSASKARSPPGGVYARLEAEWRERHGTRPPRAALSARQRQPLKYK